MQSPDLHFIYAARCVTKDPCLVLNDLAHSSWKFLSLHQSPGHDSLKDSLQCQIPLFIYGFLFLKASDQTLSNKDSSVAPLITNSPVNGEMKCYPLITKAHSLSLVYIVLCLGQGRLGSGGYNLW